MVNITGNDSTHPLVKSTEMISYRGPDDEGYILWNQINIEAFAGNNSCRDSIEFYRLRPLPETAHWKVGFGHRRLSIIDLSPGGHQPMIDEEAGLALTYNGEIYNYKEIRVELSDLGYKFLTDSDTEVLLNSWKAWGKDALNKFNGMFAFVLLDSKDRKLFAVRDRFGIKPLYYHLGDKYLAFSSEVKQIRSLPDYHFELNENNAYEYLRYGAVDHNCETFEKGVEQVEQGSLLVYDLDSAKLESESWYTLKPSTWHGTFEDACENLKYLLQESVNIRMRSDVPLGSALSGGLDSSTIVSLMRHTLNEKGIPEHLIKTVTSCHKDSKYDEWEFAEEVIKYVNAVPHQVFPTFSKFVEDIDRLIWHMDYPMASTSQFSQWCVFEGAAAAGLKVMIDGQGADEQLAGYGGNDLALYTGLLGQFKLADLIRETISYKKYHGNYPTGFVIGALQYHVPQLIINLIPDKYKVRKQNPPHWIKTSVNGQRKFSYPPNLRSSLTNQVKELPLPSLLRYEDRNSMAFSVESRVPFMDYRLIEFTLGLPESYVYKNGERKHILRRSFRGDVPDMVLDRRDKMGFVSAEEKWLTGEGKSWFIEQIMELNKDSQELISKKDALSWTQDLSSGKTPYNFDVWRMINFNRFLNMVNK